uniref:C-type lectin domain-containing protein n=1 Tax=Sinocyclocheilus anshuiensis TaxID=1608454 RepID=A0A671T5P9_9TELE
QHRFLDLGTLQLCCCLLRVRDFYYISSEKKSWSDSSRDCQQKGANLVIINSSKEQDFVQKIAVSDHFWIGLGKMEGEWKWIGGTIMANG